jgi:pimeloyl-ACP methyl ester carboxylesterase
MPEQWLWEVGLGTPLIQLPWRRRGRRRTGSGPQPMRLGFCTHGGVSIRYAESAGPAPESILLTSPWPESVYAFAPIWPALTERFRVVAVDLPGFGGSQRRGDLLTPRAMARYIVRLIEEWDLPEPHVVGPDVGTSAVLFAAADRPDLISSVVVGSGGAAASLRLSGPLAERVDAPDLDRDRAVDARAVVGAALDTIRGYALPPEVREDYLRCYEGDRLVESMRYARRDAEDLPLLAERLPAIDTPVQIIAGRRDPLVPMANAELLDQRLPHSRLVTVDAGHFVWEEASAEYASLVSDWVAGGHRDASSP